MTESQTNCIFCQIINHEIPESEIAFESENVIVIKDIRPAALYHYLALPKRHIQNVKFLTKADKSLLLEMKDGIDKVFEKNNVGLSDTSYGFHWPPFYSIGHLHLHGIAPVSKMGLLSRLVFRPNNVWYCTFDYVMQWVEKK